MVWRVQESHHVSIIIYVLMVWLAAAERSEDFSFASNQPEERHSNAKALEMRRDGNMAYVDVKKHDRLKLDRKPKEARPNFADPSERGAEDELQFDKRTHFAEECDKEIVDAGTPDEKRGEAAELHCCGTWNVVGWHEHLKRKAKELAQHGLADFEPHDHRANSLNLQKQMELNDYMSLIVGCDFCKCNQDISKASIDLHKQTSEANEDYLHSMNNHGGGHLVNEYNHMARLSHIFDSMANNMSIRRTIDTATHAIDLSQEVARITKNYKERMNMMSDGGHAIMKNITAFSKNPAYLKIKPQVDEYFATSKKPGRQVDFRSLRTFVERMGVLSERPDAKFQYYRILPTELRNYTGKKAQVRGWDFVSQTGTPLHPTCDEGNALEDFGGVTFNFQTPAKLGKLGFIPTSNEPDKDMLRFTLEGSQDKKSWTRIFNAVVPPPAVNPKSRERDQYIWVNVEYKELTPEKDPHTPHQVMQEWMLGAAGEDCDTTCEKKEYKCQESMWPLSEHHFAVITMDMKFEDCGQPASAIVAAITTVNSWLSSQGPAQSSSQALQNLSSSTYASTPTYAKTQKDVEAMIKYLRSSRIAPSLETINVMGKGDPLSILAGVWQRSPNYLHEAIRGIDEHIGSLQSKLPSSVTAPIKRALHPHIDAGAAISNDEAETGPSWSEASGKCHWRSTENTPGAARCDKKASNWIRFCPCQKQGEKQFYDEQITELADIFDHFPSPSLLAFYADGPNLRRKYHDSLTKLRAVLEPKDSKTKMGYGDMRTDGSIDIPHRVGSTSTVSKEPYALGGGLQKKMIELAKMTNFEDYDHPRCGKLELTKERDENDQFIRAPIRSCFKESEKGDKGENARSRFKHQLSEGRRKLFRWLFKFFRSWLTDENIPGGNSWDVFDLIKDVPVRDEHSKPWADAVVRDLEKFTTGGDKSYRSSWLRPSLVEHYESIGKFNDEGFFANLPLHEKEKALFHIVTQDKVHVVHYSDHYREQVGEYLGRVADDADEVKSQSKHALFTLAQLAKYSEERQADFFPVEVFLKAGTYDRVKFFQVLQWLVRQERLFIHEAIYQQLESGEEYADFRKMDNALFLSVGGVYADVDVPVSSDSVEGAVKAFFSSHHLNSVLSKVPQIQRRYYWMVTCSKWYDRKYKEAEEEATKTKKSPSVGRSVAAKL